jgi:hypothetical protein
MQRLRVRSSILGYPIEQFIECHTPAYTDLYMCPVCGTSKEQIHDKNGRWMCISCIGTRYAEHFKTVGADRKLFVQVYSWAKIKSVLKSNDIPYYPVCTSYVNRFVVMLNELDKMIPFKRLEKAYEKYLRK